LNIRPQQLGKLRLLDAETLSHARAAQRQRTRLHAADAEGIDAEGDDASQRAYAAARFDQSVESYRYRLKAAGADDRVSPDDLGTFPSNAPPTEGATATVIPFRLGRADG
jgi:hypothetical protein